jgi:hypothetical protein
MRCARRFDARSNELARAEPHRAWNCCTAQISVFERLVARLEAPAAGFCRQRGHSISRSLSGLTLGAPPDGAETGFAGRFVNLLEAARVERLEAPAGGGRGFGVGRGKYIKRARQPRRLGMRLEGTAFLELHFHIVVPGSGRPIRVSAEPGVLLFDVDEASVSECNCPAVAISEDSMAAHRFHVGDLVEVSAMGVSPGPYRVTQLLPASNSGEINYRAVELASGQERALVERSMRIWTGREA